MVSLMEKRFGGNLNLVNPGPISLYEIAQLYKQIVDPTVDPQPIGVSTERGQIILGTKGNCALDTSLLEKLEHNGFRRPTNASHSLLYPLKKVAAIRRCQRNDELDDTRRWIKPGTGLLRIDAHH
ncbi:hypothetical protein KIN20_034135 [Parelaphostrongylus tenuis]|uniref:Uncharacterized protein n=1 Tax=Parelaphostrongylus tenuis TaxID=148309 RepID=A0AAD5RBU4_PARTN|nr:hypothetical protein KIN20_034135 [Parelaphostrongylus tenuis]